MTENVDARLDETEVRASLDNEALGASVEEVVESVDEIVDESATDDVPVLQAAEVEDSAIGGDDTVAEEAGNDVQSPAAEEATGVPAAEVNEEDDGEAKRVVRMLAVGQQVDGIVRRITDFGAFVDIGVGRDGLIHISELSTRRVAKVGDILSEKQQIQPWIKKLDRKRNRISLTLIDPEMKTIRDLEAGAIVQGTVTRILPYGAFVDLGIGRDALLHVREMSTGFVEKPEDIVQVGETIEARIIEVSRRRGRVDLSLKGLREEPEPEPAIVEEIVPEEELEEVDQFEDVEVLSPMELAFKKAVEAEGVEVQVDRRRSKRDRHRDAWSIQDEIIARTLDTGRK